MRIAVVICSLGRPEALAATLPWLARQTLAPAEVLLVVTRAEDLPDLLPFETALPLSIEFAPKGLTRQRNWGLDRVQAASDVVFFIDDDYLPSATALEGLARSFNAFPEASGITGRLLADGIGKGGIDYGKAGELLAAYEMDAPSPAAPRALKRRMVGLYGCNMGYRSDRIGNTRFDEGLPLYGWQEDVDFAARLPGEKLKSDAVVGVHCGTVSGRETRGKSLGYSQVANVAYLMKKGSMPASKGLKLIGKSFLYNHLRTLWSEAWIDRKGRALGNRTALWDLIRGKSAPERILEF
ncbi:MAG: family 2 glycosyl transferase [Pseudomonadota bacterium]